MGTFSLTWLRFNGILTRYDNLHLTLSVPGKPEGRKTARTTKRIEFKILARKIKKLREKAKIGGAELSERIGKPRGYIYKIETGRQYPDFASILDILRVLSDDPLAVIGEVMSESESSKKAKD